MPTSFRRNLKFKSKPETRLDEFELDGGLITDENETKLKSNQSPNMANFVFNQTSVKTRNGYAKYNSSSIGSNPITGLIRFYGDAGLSQTIAKYNTALYLGNDIAGTFSAITLGSGVSLDTGFIDWTISNGTLLVVDGTNKIQKYRGSSNANYTTGTISVTTDSATVTGSSTVWATSTNAVAGEYIKLPDGKWYKIISIASNTSLTIETNYQGSTVSGQTYKISAWGEVQGKLNSASLPAVLVTPTPTFIENHINRIWTLEGNIMCFSVLDTSVTGENFNDWDTSNNAGQINLTGGKNTDTTGLVSFNGSLYAFQRRAIWRLQGNAPANFEVENVSNEIGLVHKKTLIEWNGLLIFLSDQGVIAFDGTNLRNISKDKVNVLIKSWANKTSATAVLWDNKYVLNYTPTGDSTNSEAIFCDLIQGNLSSNTGISVGGRWGRFTNVPANIWSTWNGGTDNGEVYFGDSVNGYVYRWDTGTTDAGIDILAIYDTPSIGFNKNVQDKTIKKFYVQQKAQDDYNMLVRMYTDVNQGPTSVNINLSPGSVSLWDVATWDSSTWSSEGDIITSRVSEFQGLAKYYKFRFEASDPIEVLGITVTERERRL